jgi:hypothetical protein
LNLTEEKIELNKETHSSYVSTQESSLQNLEIYLNGYLINGNDIIDIQIEYGGPFKIGSIIFSDKVGIDVLSNIPISDISIGFEDFSKARFLEVFNVIKVFKNEDSDAKPIIEVTFESKYSRLLKDAYANIYKSNTNPVDFISHIFKTYNIPVVLYNSDNPKVFESLLTTSDINLYEWLLKFCKQYGVVLVSDRYTTYCIDSDVYNYNNLNFSEESEYANRDKVDSFRKINEYRVKELDYKFISANSTSKEYYFNMDNSVIKPVTKTLSDYYNKYKISENGYVGGMLFPEPFVTGGYRLRDENNLENTLNNNQTIEIVMKGLNNDRLLKKINITINNPGLVEDINYMVSGTYIIKKVIDKINMSKFYHCVELDRVDYVKNKYLEKV